MHAAWFAATCKLASCSSHSHLPLPAPQPSSAPTHDCTTASLPCTQIGVPCGHITMCAPCSVQYLAKHKECPACAGQLDSLFIPGRGLVKPNAWTAR